MEKRDIVIRYFQKEAGLKKRHRRQTFASFTVKDGHEDAYRATQNFAEQYKQGETKTGLLIVGPVGCGKTHLAAAILNQILDNWQMSRDRLNHASEQTIWFGFGNTSYHDNPPNMAFTSVVSMLEKIRAAYGANDESAQGVLSAYARVGVLILDDLGTEKMTEWAGERLFEIIDHRYCEELPTIITTNLPPAQLKQVVGDRVYDRVREMCRMVSITALSQRPTAGATGGKGELA